MANNEPIIITSGTIAGYETVDAKMSIKVYPKQGQNVTPHELRELETTYFKDIKNELEKWCAGIPVERSLSSVDIPNKYRIERSIIHYAKEDMSLDKASRELAKEYSSVLTQVFGDPILRDLIIRKTLFYVPSLGKFQIKPDATFDDLSPHSRSDILHHPLRQNLLSKMGKSLTADNIESSFPNKESLKRKIRGRAKF